ncbi:MFS transporter [Krasilnikovia sp. MM14-A1259]|uniref:MFS transporter n=1 Tax=Krasilnikovia sp. MM14-A1259 TaxID=3373539 RepID=UPI003805ABF2
MLIICSMSILLVSLDTTIVNIALPAIRSSLGASLSGLQWTIDGYTLVLASLLMLSGSLGDRLGRRRVFQAGLALFTLGSLLCGLAPSLGWLIAFRVLQAVGGSMLSPVAMAIVVNTFSDPKQRARAIGVWGGVVGVSMALGPILGGTLVERVGWPSIFWVNVPIGVAALVLTRLFVPESRAAAARAADPAGQILVLVLLGTLTYAIIDAPRRGWLATGTLALFGVAVAAAVTLGVVEPRRRAPLIDFRFFRSVPFTAATLTAVAAFATLGAFLFVNTLYLQSALGYSPVVAGLFTLPMAVTSAVFAPVSGRLVAARGARLPLVLAGIFTASGAALLIDLAPDTSHARLFAAYTLIGMGFGLVNAPITNTATSGMPRARAGVASATASTSRQVGVSLGVAIGGSLIAGASGAQFTADSHAVWAGMIGCGVVIVLLGVLSTGRTAARTAARTSYLLEAEVTDAQQRTAAAA